MSGADRFVQLAVSLAVLALSAAPVHAQGYEPRIGIPLDAREASEDFIHEQLERELTVEMVNRLALHRTERSFKTLRRIYEDPKTPQAIREEASKQLDYHIFNHGNAPGRLEVADQWMRELAMNARSSPQERARGVAAIFVAYEQHPATEFGSLFPSLLEGKVGDAVVKRLAMAQMESSVRSRPEEYTEHKVAAFRDVAKREIARLRALDRDLPTPDVRALERNRKQRIENQQAVVKYLQGEIRKAPDERAKAWRQLQTKAQEDMLADFRRGSLRQFAVGQLILCYEWSDKLDEAKAAVEAYAQAREAAKRLPTIELELTEEHIETRDGRIIDSRTESSSASIDLSFWGGLLAFGMQADEMLKAKYAAKQLGAAKSALRGLSEEGMEQIRLWTAEELGRRAKRQR